MERIPDTRFEFGDFFAEYLSGVTNHWLKVAPRSNPAMLEMLRDRDCARRDILYFAGEFAGKYLTGAVQVLRITRDAELRAFLQTFVSELISLQDDDGYIGAYPRSMRLTNRLPVGETNALNGQVWDTWGMYHLMLGLLLWYDETHQRKVLRAVRRMGDLLCERFLDAPPGKRLVDTGTRDPYGWTGTQMNLSPIHSLALLYQFTGVGRYRALAEQIAQEFSARDEHGEPLAGDYIQTALDGKEFFETPRPRWESLHAVMGLAELHRITGNETYRRAFEQIWWSICRLDRHNNGGFGTNEQAVGNPYAQGAIETCGTVAWMALSVEMLKITNNPLVADELELSLFNSVLGYYSPTGRWNTYNTPMDGERRGFLQDAHWQARAGSPELNCCSANAPRGFGLVGEWALMRDDDGLVLNYFGACEMTARVSSAVTVTLKQDTAYPIENRVRVQVTPSRTKRFTIKLRVPQWSTKTRVRVNGERVLAAAPASYLALDRVWRRGDVIEIVFDFSPHVWIGERECAGKFSCYRGPLLLAFDHRYNSCVPDAMPRLDLRNLGARRARAPRWFPRIVLFEYRAADGQPVYLCDFASAGATGTRYRSWLGLDPLSLVSGG